MELTVGVNSYMDLDEAKALLDEELFSDDEELLLWNTLGDDDKTKLIIKGTRLIDKLPFRGVRNTLYKTDVLSWPRIINYELVECPRDVKLGLLRQTLKDKINRSKHESKLIEMGVTSYKVSEASISFGDKNISKLSNGIYTEIYDEYLHGWIY